MIPPLLYPNQGRTPQIVRRTVTIEIQELFHQQPFKGLMQVQPATTHILNLVVFTLILMLDPGDLVALQVQMEGRRSIISSQHRNPTH